MRGRRSGYRAGWLPSTRFPDPVISVGNITWGGTGKTPLVATLAEALAGEGRRPAIVSRGYGRIVSHSQPVLIETSHIEELDADSVGDEALEYGLESFRWSRDLSHSGVVVSSDRERGVRFAFEELDADTVILDDGFQHLAINRDLDIVVLDPTNPWASGLLRESRKTVRNAQLVALSRTDVADNREIEAVLKELRDLGYAGPVLRGCHQPSAVLDVTSVPFGMAPVDELKGKSVLLVTGVANPEGVKRTVSRLGVNVKGTIQRLDHHRYYLVDVMRIVAKAEQLEVDTILTTRKDAVKLAQFVQQDSRDLSWLAVQIAWRWKTGEETLLKMLEATWQS